MLSRVLIWNSDFGPVQKKKKAQQNCG
uniref:Uncharacterized protein n=1 Tax=Arundo donax TaxID=35708 RepID=A0A0A8Y314_ARUDO